MRYSKRMSDDRLAHYSILDKIGEGGMGEVFRARDTRLGRDVALKFLPESLANDAERLARFEREAQVLASLNHPNIAAIHGFEHIDGKRFLVLELVEGEDLSQRLVRGPFSWQEALPIAHQIAEALEAAHEENIVHRDLKPANILLTPMGTAKVLDFGLAKSWESDSAKANLTNSPTILSNSPSMTGVIMGTAAYMSPEQARGLSVDKRADIFAFGCVLYEMLTGKQCFGGATISDILAAIIRADPDWDALPRQLPQSIVRLLHRCLDKEPKTRLRDIGEARIALYRALHGPEEETPTDVVASTPAVKRRAALLPWVLAVAFAVVAGVFARQAFKPTPAPEMTQTSILTPEGVRLNLRGVHPGPVAISPDGKRIVYTGRESGGIARLYLRDLDKMETRALRGTEDAGYPFWSPDGRSVAFFSSGRLKRVDIAGGPPRRICEAPVGKGGTWNANGMILFAPTFTGGLYVVSENGGETREVTRLRTDQGENSHRFPRFLDDGEHFIYLARHGGEANKIRVASLAGDLDKEIMVSSTHADYASGYLFYVRETTLIAQPFDSKEWRIFGEPVTIADPVRFIPAAARGVFDVSRNGRVVFQSGTSVMGSQMLWRTMEGEEISRLGEVIIQDNPQISPDGRYVAFEAFTSGGGTGDIWVHDLEREVKSRFTFDMSADEDPVWSPDGKRLAFSSARDGKFGIYTKEFGGASTAELFLETSGLVFPTDWTANYIVYFATDSTNVGNIMAVPVQGDRQPIAIVATEHGEYNGIVSEDGQWLAYISDESGAMECYLTSFPDAQRKWQISTNGGIQPHWDPLGKGIYYLSADGFLVFVEVEWHDKTVAIGAARNIFEVPNAISYQIAAAGKRVLLLEDADTGSAAPLTLITNWNAGLQP